MLANQQDTAVHMAWPNQWAAYIVQASLMLCRTPLQEASTAMLTRVLDVAQAFLLQLKLQATSTALSLGSAFCTKQLCTKQLCSAQSNSAQSNSPPADVLSEPDMSPGMHAVGPTGHAARHRHQPPGADPSRKTPAGPAGYRSWGGCPSMLLAHDLACSSNITFCAWLFRT